MINLKEECGSLGITIAQLVDWSGTPRQTLKDWCVKHPKRIEAYLFGYAYFLLSDFSKRDHSKDNLLSIIERLKVTIDTQAKEIQSLR